LLALAATAAAQPGRVQGTVKDDSGKPIRGAAVVARNPDAAPASYTAITDERGRWVVIGLPSGLWTFTASAPGFRATTAGGRIGSVGTNPHFEFRLERGDRTLALGRPASPQGGDLGSADALLAAGNLDEAIAAYEAILARGSAPPAVSVGLARAYRLRRDYDRALAALASVPPGSPLAAEAALETGLALFERGDLAAADEVLTRAASARQAGRDVFYALGEVKLAQSRPGEAVTWYQRAAEADPAWARPLLKLGLVAANHGDGATAERYFERVVALAPGSLEASQARTLLGQLR
jgi:tetratricopeptide (TPR) repeat protein